MALLRTEKDNLSKLRESLILVVQKRKTFEANANSIIFILKKRLPLKGFKQAVDDTLNIEHIYKDAIVSFDSQVSASLFYYRSNNCARFSNSCFNLYKLLQQESPILANGVRKIRQMYIGFVKSWMKLEIDYGKELEKQKNANKIIIKNAKSRANATIASLERYFKQLYDLLILRKDTDGRISCYFNKIQRSVSIALMLLSSFQHPFKIITHELLESKNMILRIFQDMYPDDKLYCLIKERLNLIFDQLHDAEIISKSYRDLYAVSSFAHAMEEWKSLAKKAETPLKQISPNISRKRKNEEKQCETVKKSHGEPPIPSCGIIKFNADQSIKDFGAQIDRKGKQADTALRSILKTKVNPNYNDEYNALPVTPDEEMEGESDTTSNDEPSLNSKSTVKSWFHRFKSRKAE